MQRRCTTTTEVKKVTVSESDQSISYLRVPNNDEWPAEVRELADLFSEKLGFVPNILPSQAGGRHLESETRQDPCNATRHDVPQPPLQPYQAPRRSPLRRGGGSGCRGVVSGGFRLGWWGRTMAAWRSTGSRLTRSGWVVCRASVT